MVTLPRIGTAVVLSWVYKAGICQPTSWATRVQVLAHDHVLELSRFDQQAPQLLAVLHHRLRLGHHGLPGLRALILGR